MKKETNEILNIIHKNHERANTEYKINEMMKNDRAKFKKQRERKNELSENRAMVMMVVSFALLTLKLWGLI